MPIGKQRRASSHASLGRAAWGGPNTEPIELTPDERERALQQVGVISLMHPTARTRRMWQWNRQRRAANVVHAMRPADQLIQRQIRKESGHGELTDGNK